MHVGLSLSVWCKPRHRFSLFQMAAMGSEESRIRHNIMSISMLSSISGEQPRRGRGIIEFVAFSSNRVVLLRFDPLINV